MADLWKPNLRSSLQRSSKLRRHGLVFVLLLALTVPGVGQVRARPASAGQKGSLTVSPRSLRICRGQTSTVKVTARLLTARSRGSRPSKQPPKSITTLTAESSSGSASVAPGSTYAAFRSRGTASFAVTGISVGAGVLTFRMNPPTDDDVIPLGPRSTARSLAFVPYEVVECTYNVVLRSSWSIERAWHYSLGNSLRAEVVPAKDGTFSALPVVVNVHVQLIPIPASFCNKRATVEKTRAQLRGSITDKGLFQFDVTYDAVREPVTTIACTTPVGNIGALGQGTGIALIYTPRPLQVFRSGLVPGRPVVGTYVHMLRTDLAEVQGRGHYVIIPVAVGP